jgi:IS30 family transposase
MVRHVTITKSVGAPVYFCDSRSPWQLLALATRLEREHHRPAA